MIRLSRFIRSLPSRVFGLFRPWTRLTSKEVDFLRVTAGLFTGVAWNLRRRSFFRDFVAVRRSLI